LTKEIYFVSFFLQSEKTNGEEICEIIKGIITENYICQKKSKLSRMNPLAVIGAFIITLALLSYGISNIAVNRFKIVTPGILIFLTLGVLLDIVAVIFMIVGSDKSAFTLHGYLGYSAMLTMIINLILVWRWYLKNGIDTIISNWIILYSKIAYAWWLIVYITGSLLVIWK
jgi:hypothetical protein